MYKCPLAGGCLLEVNSGGSCLCMVNREHFWKVMGDIGEEGGAEEQQIGQLLLRPPNSADLELMLYQAFVYVFSVHFSTAYTSCLRLRGAPFGVTDARNTWATEGTSWNALASEVLSLSKLYGLQHTSYDNMEKIRSPLKICLLFSSSLDRLYRL